MKNNYYKEGYLLIQTLVFAAIAVVVIAGLMSYAAGAVKLSRQAINSTQAFEIAEAGIEYYRWHLAHAPTDYTDGTGIPGPYVKNFYDKNGILLGVYSLTITPPVGTSPVVTIHSEGRVASDPNVKRTVVSELVLGDGVSFHYGIQVGQGGFQLSNNAGVNGSVYSNGSISGQNGSYITGDAIAVGSISGINVSGTTQTGVTAQAFPISDDEITNWKDEAAAGGTVGNQNLSGANNILGPKKIQGNLTLSNNARLRVTGTLWITGNLTLSNGAEIILDASYGASDGMVIVDGVSTLSNGSNFEGSGTTGSYIMLLSTNNTGNAIVLSNNAGAVILYAPNGTVQLSNGAEVQQITAYTISLSNNATIDYDEGLINSAFTSGPSGGYTIESWREE